MLPWSAPYGAFPGSFRAKALARGDQIQGLDEAGLPLSVVARDDVEPRSELELDLAEIAKAADDDALETKLGAQGQMRIGMTTAR